MSIAQVGVFARQLAKQAIEEGIQKFVAGAVVADNRKVLILKRKPDDFMPNIYELPSGGVEREETITDGLYREVQEETGLKILDLISYLGHFDYQSQSGKKTRQFNFAVRVNLTDPVVLTEHSDYAWCSEEQLKNYEITEKTMEVIQKFFDNPY